MIRQLPTILLWLGFIFVTLLAVIDYVPLGSVHHVYGTVVFLGLIIFSAIGSYEAKEKRKEDEK